MPYRQLAYVPDRRSTRIDHSVPLTLHGVDALGISYTECVSTVVVNCHGCSYESRSDVLPGAIVTLEAAAGDDRGMAVAVPARVKSVRRLVTRQVLFEVAVELDSPVNIWGVDRPPEDWLPAEELKALAPVVPVRELSVVPRADRPGAPKPVRSAPTSPPEANGKPAPLPPLLAQLMAGFNEQIEVAVREAVGREKARLLNDLRTVLMDELQSGRQLVSAAPSPSAVPEDAQEANKTA